MAADGREGEPIPITTLGRLTVAYPDAKVQRTLSKSRRHLLAVLVAAGPGGADADELSSNLSPDDRTSDAAIRVSVARLREHLRPHALPVGQNRRYRLAVDAVEVDVWLLEEMATGVRPLDVDIGVLRRVLSPGEPFGGVPESPLIDAARYRVREAQRLLFDRLADERPDLLRRDLLADLREHYALDPFNEELLRHVATVEQRCGNRREALQAIDGARRLFRQRGLSLSSTIDALEMALLDDRLPDDEVSVPPQPELPDVLEHLLETPHVGGGDELERLLAAVPDGPACRRVLVTGSSGVGKTRLCARFAQWGRDHGVRTVYAAAAQEVEQALGALSAAMPQLRTSVQEWLTATDDGGRRAAVSLAVSTELARLAGDGPLVLLVDDAQWLDSLSIEALAYVARAQPLHPLLLVVVGRPDAAEPDGVWEDLARSLRGVTVDDEIELGPLSPDAIHALIGEALPIAGDHVAHQVVTELHAASGGLPAVATALIAQLDTETTLLPQPGDFARQRPLDGIVRSLDADVCTIGAAAALLGMEFDLDGVKALAGMGDAEVVDALDELVRRELVVERSALRFRFAHVLIQDALWRGVSATRRHQWHQAAAVLFADDVHRRAHHLHQAGSAPVAEITDALAASAQAYADAGLHREAIGELRRAEALVGELSLHHCAALARSLDRIGHEEQAAAVRTRGIARAMARGDHDAALLVATSGLPESERVDGDELLVRWLTAIDPERLDPAHRHAHAFHLARQLAVVGRPQEARHEAERSFAHAATAADRAHSAAVARFALSTASSPAERLEQLARADIDELDVAGRSELLFLGAIDFYEAADTASAGWCHRELEQLGPAVPPLRAWHTMLFEAMRLTDHGRLADAGEQRDAALDFALRAGITEAENVRFAPEFVDRWLRDGLEELAVLADGGGPSEGSVLGRAARTLVLDSLGREHEALDAAGELAADVVAAPRAQGPAAVALVSSVLARGDTDLRRACYDLLAPRGGSILIIGACVACIGPADRYLALLSDDPAEQRRHQLLAVATADQSELVLWKAVSRRDRNPAAAETRSLSADAGLG